MVEVTDSGFTPENLADAEWLWTNLPTFPRNWSTLPTHEKALVIHTVIRHREAAAKTERDMLRGTLEHIIEYWNRDQNEYAMSDALWHIIETASDALSAIKEQHHD